MVFSDAKIDQARGVERAAKLGYKRVVVMMAGGGTDAFADVREIERQYAMDVTVLSLCNTGVYPQRIQEIAACADVVWSCGSPGVRSIIGAKAIMQISKAIPVFVLTKKGLRFAASYFDDAWFYEKVSDGRQYLVSDDCGGKTVRAGNIRTRLCDARLPAFSEKAPVCQAGCADEIFSA